MRRASRPLPATILALVLLAAATHTRALVPSPDATGDLDTATTPATGTRQAPASPGASELDELMALYEARDYFTLRERLAPPRGGPLPAPPSESPRAVFLRAAVLHAFNRPADSNAAIESLLDGGGEIPLPPDLSADLLELKMNNHLRLHRYAAAHATARRLLEASNSPGDSPVDPELLDGVANMAKAYGALEDVPPQQVSRNGATILEVERGRISARFGAEERRLVFDTGANLSTIIRSEAESLGLDIRPAGIEVGTSTDVKVTADVAVAERLTIGGLEFRHVVFLVLDDELMTFDTPGGEVVIRGILGFPVIEAMGEVRFRRRGAILEVPADVPQREPRNMALDELTILVRATAGGEPILCRLDTGANDTVFYEPFFRRHRSEIEATGEPTVDRTAGAGGIREIPAYRVPELELRVGGQGTTLRDVEVYTDPITKRENNYLFCNLGLNVLGRFEEYLINFRSMTLLLRRDS